MIDGFFVENIPWVMVNIGWKKQLQKPLVILDTGFSGDLQITPKIARELGLRATEAVKVKIANGQIVSVPVVEAISSMEGDKQEVKVLIADSSPLVGIGFLSKFSYKAMVDCKNKTMALKRVN